MRLSWALTIRWCRRWTCSVRSSGSSAVEEAEAPPLMPGPSVFNYAVVGVVADALRELAGLLRAEPSSARGIAMAWCLLTDGVASPLHNRDVPALREEVGRIRYLLGEGGIKPPHSELRS
jgi:hypothetical protein